MEYLVARLGESIVYVDGKGYVVKNSDLYKSREDNELTHDELIKKYSNRIKNGNL